MHIIGTKELIKNLEDAKERGRKAAGAGLYLEANNIIGDSLREVPVDHSALENSRYVTLPKFIGSDVIVEIGYGGSAKEYAEIQHERTDFKHPAGRKAKYLQDPINKAASGFSKNVNHFASRAFAENKGASAFPGMDQKPK